MTGEVVLLLRPCRLVPVAWCGRCGCQMPTDHTCHGRETGGE